MKNINSKTLLNGKEKVLTKKTRKIIITGSHEFPEGGGGAPRCMHMLAKGFVSNECSVVVATNYGSGKDSYFKDLDGFKAMCFGRHTSNKRYFIQFLINMKARILLVGYLLNATLKKEYDLLLFYGPVAGFICPSILALALKRNTAYLMADIQPSPSKANLMARTKRKLVKFVDFVLAKTSSLMIVLGTSALEKRYRQIAPDSKQVRIWAPTDTELFASGDGEWIRQRYNLHGRKIVCYSGAIDTLEGIHHLIPAISSLVKKYPEIILVIAGPECLQDRVVGEKVDFHYMAEKYGIEDNVIFTGHLHQNQVIDLLAAADVLVMPKIDHPMNHFASPIKIAEYLAAGRPIVSSDICELNMILQHSQELLFCEPGNVEELAVNIEKIFSNSVLQKTLSKNASKAAKLYFDYRSCTKNIMSAIEL